MPSTYYVYMLKDPRGRPAKIFYIGKGTGSRATEHLRNIDETKKGKYVRKIVNSGFTPIVHKIVENLTEEQALQIELELISGLGTVDNGGVLYNSVIPKSIKRKVDTDIVVPVGSVEKAQFGLKLLKDALVSLSEENPNGITNADCAHYLGLQSDNQGRQQDYLTYSVLGLLMKEGVLITEKRANRRIYKKS